MSQPTIEVQQRRKQLVSQGLRDCTKCGEVKPLSEFPKQAGRPGGVNSNCKVCNGIRNVIYCNNNKEKIKAYNAKRYQDNIEEFRIDRSKRIKELRKNPDYVRKERIYSRAYNASEHGQQVRHKYQDSDERRTSSRKWAIRNPEKKRAGWHVWKAKQDGRLVQPPCCEACGVETNALHAHHHNGYEPEHWLDVQWLCPVCHNIAHSKPVKAPQK